MPALQESEDDSDEVTDDDVDTPELNDDYINKLEASLQQSMAERSPEFLDDTQMLQALLQQDLAARLSKEYPGTTSLHRPESSGLKKGFFARSSSSASSSSQPAPSSGKRPDDLLMRLWLKVRWCQGVTACKIPARLLAPPPPPYGKGLLGRPWQNSCLSSTEFLGPA